MNNTAFGEQGQDGGVVGLGGGEAQHEDEPAPTRGLLQARARARARAPGCDWVVWGESVERRLQRLSSEAGLARPGRRLSGGPDGGKGARLDARLETWKRRAA